MHHLGRGRGRGREEIRGNKIILPLCLVPDYLYLQMSISRGRRSVAALRNELNIDRCVYIQDARAVRCPRSWRRMKILRKRTIIVQRDGCERCAARVSEPCSRLGKGVNIKQGATAPATADRIHRAFKQWNWNASILTYRKASLPDILDGFIEFAILDNAATIKIYLGR